MMVIPQFPNLRPALFVITCLLFVVSILSISSNITSSEENELLEQEQKLISYELSEMIKAYDSTETLNESLKIQLNESKAKLSATLDSVKDLKINQKLLTKYKNRIKTFKLEKEKILSLVKTLKLENEDLKQERQTFKKALKSRDSLTSIIETKYTHLLEQKSKPISPAPSKALFLSNLDVKGAKRITSKNRVVDTRNAGRVKKFSVEFTLVKNEYLIKGPKTFYFQILDSKMNVVADKGTVSFGDKSLIYSGKKTINYTGQELIISAIINKEKDEKLESGLYYISIIHKGEIVSKTSITLK